MRSSRLPLAAVVLSCLAACAGDWFLLADDPGLAPAQAELPPSQFAQCLLPEPEEVDPERLAEAEFPHEPGPGVEAYDEVPVSPKGCIRAYQRIVGGKLVGQGLVMAAGYVEAYNAPDGAAMFREHERFLSREVLTDTSSRIEIDDDGDGFVETLLQGTYDAQGLVEQVITLFNPATGEVEERRTQRRVDAHTLRWLEERRVDGRLLVTRDEVGPSRMEQAAPAGGPCLMETETPPGACSPDEVRQIRALLKQMLKAGSECLAQGKKGPRSGKKDRDLLAHLIRTRARHLALTCYEGSKTLAHIDGAGSRPYGRHTLGLNAGHLRCGSEVAIQSTLLHEMLHITRGGHDANVGAINKAIEAGKAPPSAWWYTDSVRGCEAFCFGALKNRCSCAACFQTLTCDDACQDQPSCHERDDEGKYVMSEAVGAVCSSGLDGQPFWSGTLTACRALCAGTCKSYAVSCNPSCN